jgi:glycosyltransferase involved in cell wall biosynthesis
MKWVIVEDALRDRKGHWLEYVSTFVRELRALGDEVVVLCDRQAQGFVMEQTGSRPVLPESIWHRMGDRAGALRRYARVPGHAIATFFAMRRVFRHQFSANEDLTTIDRQGWREKEQPKVGPKGEGVGTSESKDRSELARDSENTSLTRSAIGPASALDAGRWTLDLGEALDWIFVPTVLVHHLLGWWVLLKAGSVPKESRVLLFFPNLPIRLDDIGLAHWSGGPTTKLMAWLFTNLKKEVEGGKVVLGVETHAMRRALEGLIRMPVVYLPHPVVAAQPPMTDGGGRRTEEKFEELVQKLTDSSPLTGPSGQPPVDLSRICPEARLSGGEGSGSTRPEGEISCAGAKPELPVCEQGRGARPSSLDSRPDSPATSNSLPATAAKPLVFGCYGAARWEKGSDIFQEAIKRILKNEVASAETTGVWGCAGEPANGGPKGESRGSDRGNRVSSARNQSAAGLSEPVTNYSLPATAAARPLRFCIQWVEDFRDGEGNMVSIDPWLREHPQVEVIRRYFQGDEYEQRLAQTDVMVLPYRSPYRLRVSRVVIEAMLKAMPVIATRGTTLLEQAEEYGIVVGCEEGNAEGLAEAMLEVAKRFEMLRASAEGKVNAAAESFSVGYFRDLLARNGQRLSTLDAGPSSVFSK